MKNSAMLETRMLTKVYPSRRKDVKSFRDIWDKITGVESGNPVTALKDFNLSVEEGEIFGLIGPNGAGKTTLCKILNALVLPTSGTALIDGHDVVSGHGAVTRLVFSLFGGETEMYGIFAGRMNLLKNLRFVARVWKIPSTDIESRIGHSLDLVGLDSKKDEWFQKLSAGEKQKVWLACLLLVRPKLAILDEPTIKLDVATRREFHRCVREELRDGFGSTIFLTTHNMQEAETLCDRVGVIDRGRLVAIDRPEKLKRYVRDEEEIQLLVEAEKVTHEEVIQKLRAFPYLSGLEQSRPKEGTPRVGPEGSHRTTQLVLVRYPKEVNLLDDILRTIMKAGGRILSVRANDVTLEDAFMVLTGSEGGTAPNQKMSRSRDTCAT